MGRRCHRHHRRSPADAGAYNGDSSSYTAHVLIHEDTGTGTWSGGDAAVWPWDQAWYGENSVNLWLRFAAHRPEKWWEAVLHALRFKSPGIVWFGQWFVPLGARLGSVEFGLRLCILATQAGTLALLYDLARALWPARPSLRIVGVLFAASSPLFAGMSHQFLAESLQLFAVSLVFWIAARRPDLARLELAGCLLIAASLTLLSKASSPLYVLLPATYGTVALFHRKHPLLPPNRLRRVGTALLVLGGAILTAATVAWYSANFASLRDYTRRCTVGEVASHYGKADTLSHKLGYWLSVLQKSFILPEAGFGCAVALVIALALCFAKRRAGLPSPDHSSEPQRQHRKWLITAALGQTLLVLAVLCSMLGEEARYTLPLLPSLVISLLWGCAYVATCLPWFPAAVAMLSIYQWAAVHAQALGLLPPRLAISHWVIPLESEPTTRREIETLLQDVVKIAATRGSRTAVIGVDVAWLNANSLGFTSVQQSVGNQPVRLHFHSLGYAEEDGEKAWNHLLETPDLACFISLEAAAQSQDFLNRVSLPILRRVEADPRFTREQFASKRGLVIYSRQK